MKTVVIDKLWYAQKVGELKRWINTHEIYGEPNIYEWDIFKFICLIEARDREIRKLKTQLNSCSKKRRKK